jgi:hypothetical protein
VTKAALRNGMSDMMSRNVTHGFLGAFASDAVHRGQVYTDLLLDFRVQFWLWTVREFASRVIRLLVVNRMR